MVIYHGRIHKKPTNSTKSMIKSKAGCLLGNTSGMKSYPVRWVTTPKFPIFHIPSHSSSLGLERFLGNAGGGGNAGAAGGGAGAGRATRVGSRGSKTSNCAWEMLG